MRRLVPATLCVLITLLVFPSSAGAAKYTTCDLLTKQQAGKLHGYKVVKTELNRDTSTGAEECQWRSTKYWGKNFKELDAPFKLKVTTQPVTAEVDKTLATLEADPDATTVDGVGDRVFYNKDHGLVAVVGNVALLIEVANWTTEGGKSLDKLVLAPELATAKILVPIFEDAAK